MVGIEVHAAFIRPTYGATLWADSGRPIARPRRWRLAGFVAGIVLELLVAALLVAALLRNG